VVAPGIGPGDGSAGIASEAVGDQPFPAERIRPIAADVATENQKRDLFEK